MSGGAWRLGAAPAQAATAGLLGSKSLWWCWGLPRGTVRPLVLDRQQSASPPCRPFWISGDLTEPLDSQPHVAGRWLPHTQEGPWISPTSLPILVLSWSTAVSPALPSLWGRLGGQHRLGHRKPIFPVESCLHVGWGRVHWPPATVRVKRHSFIWPTSRSLNLLKQSCPGLLHWLRRRKVPVLIPPDAQARFQRWWPHLSHQQPPSLVLSAWRFSPSYQLVCTPKRQSLPTSTINKHFLKKG